MLIKSAVYEAITLPSFYGKDELKITTSIKDVGVFPFCPVYIYDQMAKKLLWSARSDENGGLLFKNFNLDSLLLFAVIHYPNSEYNGVIADNIGGQNVDV